MDQASRPASVLLGFGALDNGEASLMPFGPAGQHVQLHRNRPCRSQAFLGEVVGDP